ncbi:nuclease (SNase domain protein) [Methanohalobium evestigatum Z-7303]|uniref:Nuclease (SNase domain protein) n=1 Tax=Methanohalobium evestigatum (strain ATCC BAA-1072 / DSM 3721 / NBRC 107634 / OCM 161 / Z-7303) TaxID=644295 RepID=D7E821_METEZ|nr:thermonuclease family protein [Methanohalobium evestigatum]ADI73363.1 nuclease (SNase domain protein) [Methanohalobium evestigatum Z-7303]
MNKISFKIIAIITVCLFLLILSGCIDADNNNVESNDTNLVTVIKVVDGDTIDIRYSNGTTERVRLLGVDTPETHAENKPEEFEGIDNDSYLHEWGVKANNYTSNILEDKEVRLEYDDISDRRGYYGRLLAYVYLKNDTMYNRMLIKDGYARVYDEAEIEYMDEFLELEKEARENKKGLWGVIGKS